MAFTSFEAESESLYDLVSKNGRGLYIPPYQRDYSWDNEKVDRLYTDLLQSIKTFILKEERNTFLGTIIVLEGKAKEIIDPQYKRQAFSDVLSIIDGQQRLTTLLIFCIALLVNIEVKWKKLLKNSIDEEDYKTVNDWIEESVNILRGNVQNIIFEKQNNGEEIYKFFPKMIRSYVDQWSYQKDNAKYTSPISWLLFEYIKFANSSESSGETKRWDKFRLRLKESLKSEATKEKQHVHKVFERLYKYIDKLYDPKEDEQAFPDFKDWKKNIDSQEHFFIEEFPDELINLFEVNNDVEYLNSAIDILSTLAFTKFVINNIALIVVVVKDEDYAFDIFEALNSTGQPLTAIETFVPIVVKEVGIESYKDSIQKIMIDSISEHLNQFSTQNKKQKASKDLIISFALAERGEKVGNNLSEQRAFMRNAFHSSQDIDGFLQNLLSISRFYQNFWIKSDESPNFSSSNISLDKESELCLQFLVALKHTITIPLLSQYMMAVEQCDIELKEEKLREFKEVIKSVATFTTLWRSSKSSTGGIDAIYRDIMMNCSTNNNGTLPVARQQREELPSSDDIKLYFRNKLENNLDLSNLSCWIETVTKVPIYRYNSTVTRFILLVAFNDIVESEESTKLVRGKENTHPTLSSQTWHNDIYATIEHIAPQDPDNNSDWKATDIYDDDEILHHLGNLTLIPLDSNASLSNRDWKIKKELFQALSAKTADESQQKINEINQSYSLSLNKEIYSGTYLPHLYILSKYDSFNKNEIDNRGLEIANFAKDIFSKWLY